MRLTVVGCSGSFPGPESAASCYLVEAEGPDGPTGAGRTWRILLDLGNGALGPLQRYVDPLAIDAVFLTHLHPDHCLDLCGYYVLRHYHPHGDQPRLPVWGPAGTAERMERAYDRTEGGGMTGSFAFAEYDGAVTLGPFTVQPVPVVHPVVAYALRVTAGGRVLAYSGDTAPCEGLGRVAADADLLLAEAAFVDDPDNPPGIHLTGTDAGEAAAAAAASRLVLTHIPPWHDTDIARAAAAAAYAGPLDVAIPSAVFEV